MGWVEAGICALYRLGKNVIHVLSLKCSKKKMKRTISGKVAAECKRRDATYENYWLQQNYRS